jgi:hypothetical protein
MPPWQLRSVNPTDEACPVRNVEAFENPIAFAGYFPHILVAEL